MRKCYYVFWEGGKVNIYNSFTATSFYIAERLNGKQCLRFGTSKSALAASKLTYEDALEVRQSAFNIQF
jgi:hypothetical protein